MQKLLILSVTGLMLICGGYIPGMSVSAQNTTSSSTQNSRKISGVVTDTQGEPIIGATVLVKEQASVQQQISTANSLWIFHPMEKPW